MLEQVKGTVEAVLLDAAGTLIRPRETVGQTYAEVAARFGIERTPEQLSRGFAEVFGAMPDLAFDWTSEEDLVRKEKAWWRALVNRVISASTRDANALEDCFEALYAHYAGGRAWQCFPEIPAVLNALRKRGLALAVVSNFDSRLPGILQDLGIGDYFNGVVYSSRAGSAKPDPAIFKQALDALGIPPERAVHVGDSVPADIDGAAAAGMTGFLIHRDRSSSDRSDSVIRSLAELPLRIGVAFG